MSVSTMPHYTPEVGRKFNADGSVRQFAGNTIICHLDHNSAIFQMARQAQNALQRTPYGHKFTILPLESLHMTVIELLCDETRRPEKWSAQLDLAATLAEIDDFFLRTVPPLPAPQSIAMRPQAVNGKHLGIRLNPADDAVAVQLCHYRDAVAQATGVRFLDHDVYRFHISLAYRLIELEADEQVMLDRDCVEWGNAVCSAAPVFDLGPPELVFFDHMFRFVPADARLGLRSRA